ncbi:MAG: DEAD/DEAH box helicase family protein [Pseudomonadota bacterium]
MNKLNLATAEALIDFTGGGALAHGLATQQLSGTVALYNMLAEHKLAYLADEVGMGKTYIGLGVVALMRRFQPGLRVLYLLPKNNVRDKWQKDYRSFIDKNYRLADGIVKGLGGSPAAPYRLCDSLSRLVQAVATESARDFFICTSAFSLSLGNTRDELMTALERFRSTLPQSAASVDGLISTLAALPQDANKLDSLKQEVKLCWAKALNSILPNFDLVVVDEAHNYRRGLDTSDRNRMLAAALGTLPGANCRVRQVLLLSATPFDRDIEHLRRQLQLFGMTGMLALPPRADWKTIHTALSPFMVRRLNCLELDQKSHTRNMYRTEHRTGEQAEIELGLKQQLFAALLQKKVCEALNENNSGKFELGMLASFESYLPSNKGQVVQFDGEDESQDAAAGSARDAADRSVVELLVDDYKQRFDVEPPHPKMDAVAAAASLAAFEENQKQLIFVRRVGSVGELKARVEDSYNRWLGAYIAPDSAVAAWFGEYTKLVGQRQHTELNDERDGGKTNLSTFFSWFYSGDNELLAKQADKFTTPSNFRNTLAGSSMMFATNWSTLPGMPSAQDVDFDGLHGFAVLPKNPTRAQQFERGQHAYLGATALRAGSAAATVARRILDYVYCDIKTDPSQPDMQALTAAVQQQTLWEKLRETPALESLGRAWTAQTFDELAGTSEAHARQAIQKILIHHRLTAAVCRLDHPFIDLYSLRASRDRGDAGAADDNLAHAFRALLEHQSRAPHQFSSYVILRDLADHLDVILKQNFEHAFQKYPAELTTYLANQLTPLAPVRGASGSNSDSRSAIARKFRMPGYPRVLVSTDVFQEGEDLHTFCDSVTHYGISSSPIALEQKVGRVDRIASMSHRALNNAKSNHQAHFIQVRFPHIRASLEFMQVRQSARNLNEFLRSMNRVGNQAAPHAAHIEIAEQLRDSSPIEPLLGDYLESPFPVLDCLVEGDDRRAELATAQGVLDERVTHAQQLVDACLDAQGVGPYSKLHAEGMIRWTITDGTVVVLRSAQGRDQLLLAVSAPSAISLESKINSTDQCLAYLRELQSDPTVRLQSACVDGDAMERTLRRNAEIYAGSTHILSASEVRDLYQRATGVEADGGDAAEQANVGKIMPMIAALCGRHGVHRITSKGGGELVFDFELERRQQTVRWRLLRNYIVLTANVLDSEQAAELEKHPRKLFEYTVRRNTGFDMVDFHIDESLAMSARTLHPLADLNVEELAFAASMVASEADRLNQILCGDVEEDGGEDEDEDEDGPAKRHNRSRLFTDDDALMCLIRSILGDGELSPDALARRIAREFDYQRTSARIRKRIDGVLRAAVRRGIAVREAGMMRLWRRSVNDYATEELKVQFLAALSNQGAGMIEREVAITAFARWMGYARTRSVIAGVAASLIRGLLRQGRLEANRTQIRRPRG